MNILEEVKKIVSEEIGCKEEEVVKDAKFIEDLGADSLDIVEVVMKFEETFNIEIPDADSESLVTVGDAVEYLEKKLKN